MEAHGSKRASLNRQTQLAHISLVSKYFEYPPNYSRPQAENMPPQNSFRRAGYSYAGHQSERIITLEKRTSEPVYRPQPPSPTRRRTRPQDRTSIGSDVSTPSLIDDKTDSEVSHDDDYQYHTSTSQLWDSFWVAHGNDGAKVRPQMHQQQPHPLKSNPQEPSTARYPALIPSPHIKRTKKTSIIKYGEDNVPPKPVQYSIPIQQSEEVETKKSLPPQFPTEEKRRTIRTVRSSYSLFPKQTATPVPPRVPAVDTSKATPTPTAVVRPRTASLPRPQTPGTAIITHRKSSRPQPVHANSEPLPQIPEPFEATIPARPHTSHGPSRPRASTTASRSSAVSLSSHLCDHGLVKTTTPLFPSTNLAGLINPRSAPRPPVSSLPPTIPSPLKPGVPRRRMFTGTRPKTPSFNLATQKSFFDFDSDSESETSPKHAGITRMMKKGRKSKTPESNAGPAQDGPVPQPRVSVEHVRRRKSRTNLAILGGRKMTFPEDADEDVPPLPQRAEGRKSDVFGRMFGRGK